MMELDIANVLTKNPNLYVRLDNSYPIAICGNYQVLDNVGILQGEYQIEVLIPKNYPYGFPTLIETSNTIPRIPDRHMGLDGVACVEITHYQIMLSKRGITLESFFDYYVHKYLCWQIRFEAGDLVGLEEWGHKEHGIKQFYYLTFGIQNDGVISEILRKRLKGQGISGKTSCYCGSGKIWAECHKSAYDELMPNFGPKQIEIDFQIFSGIKVKSIPNS